MNPKTYWEYVTPGETTIDDIIGIIAYCLPIAIWLFFFHNTTIWTLDVFILYYLLLNYYTRSVITGYETRNLLGSTI